MSQISVIVPIYKVEKYLAKCIDSILAQTFSDFELILVDDGSPDACPEICDAYARKDPRVVVIHRENGGLSAARNSGLEIAKGKYITFCDSDDYLAPDFLEVLYTRIEEDGADVVNGGLVVVDEAGTELYKNGFEQMTKEIRTQREQCELVTVDVLGGRLGWCVCVRLFRGDIIREHHLRFYSCFAEDIPFSVEYSLYCKKITTVDYFGYYYVRRAGSIMQFEAAKVRFNEMNIISKYLSERITALEGMELIKEALPIIHYYIFRSQYEISQYDKYYLNLHRELDKIQDRQWYNQQVRKLKENKKLLTDLAGREEAVKALLLSKYCLDGNRTYYRLASGITQKEMRQYYLNKLLHR